MTVNIAVIGCGFMGTLYASICQQLHDVRVVVVSDIQSERAQQLAVDTGSAAHSGVDYDQMFADYPSINAVLVCTPEYEHTVPARAALAANKHIMIEKPLATSIAEAEELVELAEEYDAITMIGYSLRFDPRYAAMKAAVERGDIGDIIHMSARRNMSVEVIQRLSGRVEAPFWVGVHDLDIMRWITGSTVTRVMAVATDKGMTDWNIKTVYYALLTYADGTVAALETSWAVNFLAGRPQPYMFRVEATQGQLQVRSYEMGITVYGQDAVMEPDTVYMPETFGRITGVYHDQIKYFTDCVRSGRQTEIPLRQGLLDVVAADAIIRSANEHREIVLTG